MTTAPIFIRVLQNAEDALARRTAGAASGLSAFISRTMNWRVSHFGKPFDEADVRGICGIAESTKGLTRLGASASASSRLRVH